MSDLISRSKLLKEIETWGGCVEALHEYIENMPTAYDISRVVVQLEGLKECITNHYENGIYTHTSTNYDIDTLNKAIEIVMRGGVCGRCAEAGGCPVREDCPNCGKE